MPKTSWAAISLFRSQVRVVAFETNGSVMKGPPVRWALTAENVTRSAVASLNGESCKVMFSVDGFVLGAVGEELEGLEFPHPRDTTSIPSGRTRSGNRVDVRDPLSWPRAPRVRQHINA